MSRPILSRAFSRLSNPPASSRWWFSCFEGHRCRHGHTIDVRLTHQDLAELVGAARPVVSAELVRLRDERLIAYTRCYFCVDDLDGLDRVAAG